MRKTIRVIAVTGLLSGILSAIGWLFWIQEVQYLLPTPIPEGYEVVYVSDKVSLTGDLIDPLVKPKFYHFFKPDCPCSRFNVKHFLFLNVQYKDEIDFAIVIPEGADKQKAHEYFEDDMKIIEDHGSKLAHAFGVYSTPQAVIIDNDNRLYFRGNYNRARYCTDPMSNFAQMALDSLNDNRPPPQFGPLATVSYGCGLPTNEFSLLNINF